MSDARRARRGLDVPLERQVGQADLAAVLPDRDRRVDAVIRDPPLPLLQCDVQLQPGEVRAETAVRPGAKGDVPVLRAVDDDPVGVREFVLVAVGRDQRLGRVGHDGRVGEDLGMLERLADRLHRGHRPEGVPGGVTEVDVVLLAQLVYQAEVLEGLARYRALHQLREVDDWSGFSLRGVLR